mgnify:FL=1
MKSPYRTVLHLYTAPRSDVLGRVVSMAMPLGSEFVGVAGSRIDESGGWYIRLDLAARDQQQAEFVARRLARLVDVISVSDDMPSFRIAQ